MSYLKATSSIRLYYEAIQPVQKQNIFTWPMVTSLPVCVIGDSDDTICVVDSVVSCVKLGSAVIFSVATAGACVVGLPFVVVTPVVTCDVLTATGTSVDVGSLFADVLGPIVEAFSVGIIIVVGSSVVAVVVV